MSRPLAALFALLLAGAAQARAEPPKQGGLAYRMTAGDTLYSLARWSRVRLPALLAANPGIDPRRIEIGDEICLPAGAAPPGPARFREFGNGPGPAAGRPPPQPRAMRPAPPPPPRVREMRQPPPPAPPADKPDADDEDEPMGM